MSKPRWTILAVTALWALSLTLVVACGDDDSGDDDDVATPDAAAGAIDAPGTTIDADPNKPDAPPAAACNEPALAPITDSDPPRPIPEIIISEISIEDDFVEVYNTTDAAINLASLTDAKWCTYPSYANVSSDAVIVPAKGYATIDFPISSANNELVLYKDGSYGSPDSVLDYVCWDGTGSMRKGVAETAGKWSGACAAAIPSGGSLQRKVGSAGNSAADYEAVGTPTPENCTTID